MDKYLDLGSHIESSGERRVQLLDSTLIKTASNAIQDSWASIKREPGKAYLHVLAMTATGWYSCNNNGDAFFEDDLIKYHPTFVSNANLFLLHKNKDPEKGYGKPIFSFYNKDMHRVELIIEVDKTKSASLTHSIEADEDIAVSMGARVKYDVCSICGNRAKTRAEYCDCLRYNMKKILKDGCQVYAINPGPITFFDISVVNKPADRTAWALQKAASDQSFYQVDSSMSSAERGEKHMLQHEKLAAISKLGDMIKEVDGKVAKAKMDSEDLYFPQVPFSDLEALDATPGCVLKGIIIGGALPSLGESAFIAGKHAVGHEFSEADVPQLMNALPGALRLLKHNPDYVESALADILAGSDASGVQLVARTVGPVMQERIRFVEKTAAISHSTLPTQSDDADAFTSMPSGAFSQLVGNTIDRSFATNGLARTDMFTVTGDDGEKYETSRAAVLAAQDSENLPYALKGMAGAALALAALGVGASDAKLAEKLIISPVLAALSLGMMNGAGKRKVVETDQGVEVPVSSLFTPVSEKTASMQKLGGGAGAVGSVLKHPAALFGAGVPAALAIDYMYNKKIKHRDDPYFEQRSGLPSKAIHGLGRKVLDHPVVSLTGGAVGASALRHLIKAKYRI